jgi:Fungal specific transcription factor domain
MPLTHDYSANPFRVRLDRIQESPSLLHAVMALSSQHLAKIGRDASMATEMHSHQSTAMQLFSTALNNPNSEPVLDTLLLLIIFEASFMSNTNDVF